MAKYSASFAFLAGKLAFNNSRDYPMPCLAFPVPLVSAHEGFQSIISRFLSINRACLRPVQHPLFCLFVWSVQSC